MPILEALAAGELQTAGKRVLIVRGGKAVDAISGAAVSPIPEGAEDVVVNNRLRGAVQGALAALRLTSADRSARLTAAKELVGGTDEAALPLVVKALEKEQDPEIRPLLEQIAASLQLKTGTPEQRIAAMRTLAESSASSTRPILQSLLDSEKDPDVRYEVEKACARSTRAPHGTSVPVSRSPASRSARCCCSPRSVSRSPTA